jgi:hypothetical protein
MWEKARSRRDAGVAKGAGRSVRAVVDGNLLILK